MGRGLGSGQLRVLVKFNKEFYRAKRDDVSPVPLDALQLAAAYYEKRFRGNVREIDGVNAVYRCLDSLEERGLIRRTASRGRRICWLLTPAGLRFADKPLSHWVKLFRRRAREGWTAERISKNYSFDIDDVRRIIRTSR